MPNWCENILKISYNDPNRINQFYDNNKTEENELDFNCVCPLPNELLNTESPNNSSADKIKELEEKYGYSDWYNWCCHNWGTKWNACDVECNIYETSLTYSFNTAWGPPGEWFKKLCTKYSDFNLELEYEESGMDMYGKMEHIDNIFYEIEDSLSDHVWENSDHSYIHETVENILNDNKNIDCIDELTSMVIEELYDEISNAYCLYNQVEGIIKDNL